MLGQLDDSDYQLGVTRAESSIAGAQASLDKLENGARSQEIDQARALVQKAQLNVNNAHVELNRLKALYDSGAVSKDALDNAQLRAQVADQDLRTASRIVAMSFCEPRS